MEQQQKQKTKVRFTSIDITAIVSDLKAKLVGLRVTNIYDLNPTTYLFKFAKAD
jgi:predicted ribosome quality control (RQC) complex YloA/Tae2 family protein